MINVASWIQESPEMETRLLKISSSIFETTLAQAEQKPYVQLLSGFEDLEGKALLIVLEGKEKNVVVRWW